VHHKPYILELLLAIYYVVRRDYSFFSLQIFGPPSVPDRWRLGFVRV
jgi:hypothetical protein